MTPDVFARNEEAIMESTAIEVSRWHECDVHGSTVTKSKFTVYIPPLLPGH